MTTKYRTKFIVRLALLAAFGTSVPARASEVEGHFKRFPTTVTNDGAYVLAWGLNQDPAGDVASKTEIQWDGPENIDIGEADAADYLVDVAAGKIVATIPDFGYFDGKNRYDLDVGWSPDNRGGVAIYDGRYDTEAIAWINPADHKVSDVWPQIEKAIRRVVAKKKGKWLSEENLHVLEPVFARPRKLIVDASVGNFSSKTNDLKEYSLRVTFDVKGSLDAPQLELVGAKSTSNVDDVNDKLKTIGIDVEAQLNDAYRELTATLKPADREALNQEQVKWLSMRDHLTAAAKTDEEAIRKEFTGDRILELREEALLNNAYRKLTATLKAADRETLNQEQLKWLSTRDHLTAAAKTDKEFIRGTFTLRRIRELQARAGNL